MFKRTNIRTILVALLSASSCLGQVASNNSTFTVYPAGTTGPVIGSTRVALLVGSATHTIDIYGKNFTLSAVAYFDSTPLTTVFLTTNHLQAVIPGALISSVTVHNLVVLSSAVATLVIFTDSLPEGFLGKPYSAQLQASGGILPYTWNVVSGTLPAGISLSPSGMFSGTPTTVGISNFTVQVTDAGLPPLLQPQRARVEVSSRI